MKHKYVALIRSKCQFDAPTVPKGVQIISKFKVPPDVGGLTDPCPFIWFLLVFHVHNLVRQQVKQHEDVWLLGCAQGQGRIVVTQINYGKETKTLG